MRSIGVILVNLSNSTGGEDSSFSKNFLHLLRFHIKKKSSQAAIGLIFEFIPGTVMSAREQVNQNMVRQKSDMRISLTSTIQGLHDSFPRMVLHVNDPLARVSSLLGKRKTPIRFAVKRHPHIIDQHFFYIL